MASGASEPRKTALITGASGGIGYELARVFAENGHDVVLVARSEAKLTDLARELEAAHGITAHILPKDLSRPEAPAELLAETRSRNLTVDILVNNAGFGTYGLFSETDLTEELDELQVNMVALTHLTKLCLGGMIERRTGGILNVASTAAFQPGPMMAVYSATKAYVLSFSEALANELQGTGVTATVLCPGVTRTGFQSRARMQDSRLMQSRAMDAKTVARAGYQGLMQGRAMVIPGFRNQLLAFLSTHAPRSLVVKGARWAQDRVRNRAC